MADVTLAELNGRCWLVEGEQHLDNLLMHTLPPDIIVGVVSCKSEAEMRDMWVSNGGRPDLGEQPWMIHPNILARVRNDQGGDRAVAFQPWSVRLDDAALAVVAAIAARAMRDGGMTVVLVDRLDADADASLVALNNLRLTLLARSLADHGLPADRLCTRKCSDPGAGSDMIMTLLEPRDAHSSPHD